MIEENKIHKITTAQLSILKLEGYFNRFYEIAAITKTDKEAFFLLENELYNTFLINRYTSYSSFKQMKNRVAKRKKV